MNVLQCTTLLQKMYSSIGNKITKLAFYWLSFTCAPGSLALRLPGGRLISSRGLLGSGLGPTSTALTSARTLFLRRLVHGRRLLFNR